MAAVFVQVFWIFVEFSIEFRTKSAKAFLMRPLLRLLKSPAFLLTLMLFLIANIEPVHELVRDHRWTWNIYVAFSGLVLFVEKHFFGDVGGIARTAARYGLQFAVFVTIFWILRSASRPLKWAFWLLFLLAGFSLYWWQVAPKLHVG